MTILDEMGLAGVFGEATSSVEALGGISLVNFEVEEGDSFFFRFFFQSVEEFCANPFATLVFIDDDGEEALVREFFVGLDVENSHAERLTIVFDGEGRPLFSVTEPDAHRVGNLSLVTDGKPPHHLVVIEPLR